MVDFRARRVANPFPLLIVVMGCSAVLCSSVASGQTRQEKVIGDRVRITEDGYWIYNDLFAGIEAAVEQGKPMLVTLRCIPCEECVKLDDELIESDPNMRKLLDQFIRVRLVSTNGLNLALFQYDYDQSFAMMIMNADGTIYARYGTRSDRTEWEGDVSVDGLGATLEGALKLHAGYPANREMLSGKQGERPMFATPNDAPSLRDRFPRDLAFNDNVVKNCIHCHMIGDAQREVYRSRDEAIPQRTLFQYPHPKSIGLIMDPHTRAVVREVAPDTPAAEAGLIPGDVITMVQGQSVLSMADLQWVLHHAADPDQLEIAIQRGGVEQTVDLELPEGWRTWDDLSWRVSSWPLRRMTTGGLVLKSAENGLREELGLQAGEMGLVVTHVGQYGAHAMAKQAGFQQGDVVVAFDGRNDLLRETDLLAYGVQNLMPGREVAVSIMRNGRRRELKLLMQK